MHGENSFWPKNHIHLTGYDQSFERYNRAGLRNNTREWGVHRDGATAGWMAIVSRDGAWVSGTYWQRVELLAHNAPDYDCIHGGLVAGYNVQPGQTVTTRGCVVLGKLGLKEFMDHYRRDMERWNLK